MGFLPVHGTPPAFKTVRKLLMILTGEYLKIYCVESGEEIADRRSRFEPRLVEQVLIAEILRGKAIANQQCAILPLRTLQSLVEIDYARHVLSDDTLVS